MKDKSNDYRLLFFPWENRWNGTLFQIVPDFLTIYIFGKKVQFAHFKSFCFMVVFLIHLNSINPFLTIVAFCRYAVNTRN